MNKEDFARKLQEFFLEFGALHSLDEMHVEKLERVLHQVHPKNITAVKKICAFILKHQLLERPEDEIIDKMKTFEVI